jgi:hypothetical protein
LSLEPVEEEDEYKSIDQFVSMKKKKKQPVHFVSMIRNTPSLFPLDLVLHPRKKENEGRGWIAKNWGKKTMQVDYHAEK